MAIRIDSHVLSGEVDNRVRGKVTGVIELTCGRITLDLTGNCHPDVAGTRFRFRNPNPEAAAPEAVARLLNALQTGVVGDLTASRKIRALLVPLEEFLLMDESRREESWRWANGLYLEWFSEANGRVVIESSEFEIETLDEPQWQLTEEEFVREQQMTRTAMEDFFAKIGESLLQQRALSDEEEIVPSEEAKMDQHSERMDLLCERIQRRLEREGLDKADWSQIYEEESARLRRERGEPEPEPLTWEQEEKRQRWIEEMNAGSEEAAEEAKAEAWKQPINRRHPLVETCSELAMALQNDPLIPESAIGEHPLAEIRDGVLIASGKLAGALNGALDCDEWPPDELQAPATLNFLKKARSHLQNAVLGLDSADAENLATAEWRQQTREAIVGILIETQRLIEEARAVLASEDWGDS